MEFQPSDYLSNLNLVFDNVGVVSPVDETINKADLDVFQQNEFFDFDVFFNGAANTLPQKATQVKEEVHEGVTQWEAAGAREHQVKEEQRRGDSPALPPDNSPESFESKRRKNTAASARFRIKKKQKELQMQQHAKELQDKLGAYEKRLRSLEMENKCLKQLILEKNDKKHGELLDSIKKRSLGDGNPDFSLSFTN